MQWFGAIVMKFEPYDLRLYDYFIITSVVAVQSVRDPMDRVRLNAKLRRLDGKQPISISAKEKDESDHFILCNKLSQQILDSLSQKIGDNDFLEKFLEAKQDFVEFFFLFFFNFLLLWGVCFSQRKSQWKKQKAKAHGVKRRRELEDERENESIRGEMKWGKDKLKKTGFLCYGRRVEKKQKHAKSAMSCKIGSIKGKGGRCFLEKSGGVYQTLQNSLTSSRLFVFSKILGFLILGRSFLEFSGCMVESESVNFRNMGSWVFCLHPNIEDIHLS